MVKRSMLFVAAALALAGGMARSASAADGRIDLSARHFLAPPYTITNSGSYRLTENVTITGGTEAISVEADDVWIDLNGFTLRGQSNALDGIFQDAGYDRLTVVNGTLAGWSHSGYSAIFALGDDLVVENCRFAGVRNGVWGGRGALVRDCSLSGSGAMSGSGFGLNLNVCSVVEDCSVVGHQMGSYTAITVRTGSSVSRCVVVSNSASLDFTGVGVGPGCVVESCVVYANGAGDAMRALDGSTNSIIADCSVDRNNSGVFDLSMVAGENSVVSGCRSDRNAGAAGIRAGPGAMIVDCSAASNAYDGIQLAGYCYAIRNQACGNGVGSFSAGILTTGIGNRLEDNSAMGNYAGISLSTSNNLAGANLTGANVTNFYAAAGVTNHFGKRRTVSTPYSDWNTYGNMSH